MSWTYTSFTTGSVDVGAVNTNFYKIFRTALLPLDNDGLPIEDTTTADAHPISGWHNVYVNKLGDVYRVGSKGLVTFETTTSKLADMNGDTFSFWMDDDGTESRLYAKTHFGSIAVTSTAKVTVPWTQFGSVTSDSIRHVSVMTNFGNLTVQDILSYPGNHFEYDSSGITAVLSNQSATTIYFRVLHV